MTSEKEYECINCGQIMVHTRAVPDVPELVRYDYDILEGAMEPYDSGEYVLYSQAAEIIAADRAEKHRAQEAVLKLERELAQYEAQATAPSADLKAEKSDYFMINDGVSYIHPELGEGVFFTDDLLKPALPENKKYGVTDDIRQLIVAAREVAYGGTIRVNSEEYNNLDKALEKFSGDVDWENQP